VLGLVEWANIEQCREPFVFMLLMVEILRSSNVGMEINWVTI
jgi:hypothetical protein